MRQADCTPEQGEQWQARYGDGYAAGRGDARWGRQPRIALIEIPAEIPGETGSQYVARHVEQAWEIGYSRAWRYETVRASG